jgi:hypothetical protein
VAIKLLKKKESKLMKRKLTITFFEFNEAPVPFKRKQKRRYKSKEMHENAKQFRVFLTGWETALR